MSSGAASRRKGHTFQAETAAVWRRHGAIVTPIQRSVADVLDNFVQFPGGVNLVEETKRAERAKVSEWWEQIWATDPAYPAVLTWRRSRWPSLSMLETEHLARLLGER